MRDKNGVKKRVNEVKKKLRNAKKRREKGGKYIYEGKVIKILTSTDEAKDKKGNHEYQREIKKI